MQQTVHKYREWQLVFYLTEEARHGHFLHIPGSVPGRTMALSDAYRFMTQAHFVYQ